MKLASNTTSRPFLLTIAVSSVLGFTGVLSSSHSPSARRWHRRIPFRHLHDGKLGHPIPRARQTGCPRTLLLARGIFFFSAHNWMRSASAARCAIRCARSTASQCQCFCQICCHRIRAVAREVVATASPARPEHRTRRISFALALRRCRPLSYTSWCPSRKISQNQTPTPGMFPFPCCVPTAGCSRPCHSFPLHHSLALHNRHSLDLRLKRLIGGTPCATVKSA